MSETGVDYTVGANITFGGADKSRQWAKAWKKAAKRMRLRSLSLEAYASDNAQLQAEIEERHNHYGHLTDEADRKVANRDRYIALLRERLARTEQFGEKIMRQGALLTDRQNIIDELIRDLKTERAKSARLEESVRLRGDREPSQMEMLRALGQGEQVFYDGWTVRRCRHCGRPVAGGPTACEGCVWSKKLKSFENEITALSQDEAAWQEQAFDLLSELHAEQQKSGRLTAVLRQVEWSGGGDYMDDHCPLCDQHKSKGHAPDCPIGAALGERK